MDAFPLSWPLTGRRVAVFGDGELARRKRALLAKTAAEVIAYGPRADASRGVSEPDQSGEAGRPDGAETTRGWPTVEAMRGVAFAIVAIEDREAAADAAALARAAHVPVNVVDRPELSDFHVPAIIDRGDVVIAVATGGTAPALAREVRAAIEAAVPASTAVLAAFARRIRTLVRRVDDYEARRIVWERILRGPAGELARIGDFEAAETLARAEVDHPPSKARAGVVHIVGAGPGDPELLTLKALRVLQDADLIVYDRLVDLRVLDLARRDADRIYVGKARSKHAAPQEEINALLVKEARRGRRVVRLKGGDPFVFGRGGEELAALRAAGVAAHVIPGITAALGCAAAAGAPLTHRDFAQAVTFVTGHAKTGAALDVDWRALAAANHTLVIYMGAASAAEVAASLLRAGRDGATPVLIVENGTRPDQRLIASRLAQLGDDVAHLVLASPSLLIVGEAAALADAKQASALWRAAEHAEA